MSRRRPSKPEIDAAIELQSTRRRPTWIRCSLTHEAVIHTEIRVLAGEDLEVVARQEAAKLDLDPCTVAQYAYERLEILHSWSPPPPAPLPPVHFISSNGGEP